jgi:hypothetical protein
MASDNEPVDPEVRQRVAELLYGLLPALYRVRDEPPKGQGDLRRFLSVLAAPLAEVRQSVDSLQADLFIDSARDWLLPYLAEMVGTTLVFPDAASNRRDVRGTASWRRRKGTPLTLEALANELLDQRVSTQEGWKRLLITQELNAPRLERTVPDVRDVLLREASSGPLDVLFHALGERSNPRHVTHWIHPTQLFSVRDGTAALVSNEPLYTFHPHGRHMALRVPRGRPGAPVETDRLLPVHLDRAPERYFGQDKAFAVRVCGLPAAVEQEEAPVRRPSSVAADLALLTEGELRLTVLEKETRGWTGMMTVTAAIVPLRATSDPSVWSPVWGNRTDRRTEIITRTDNTPSGTKAAVPSDSPRVVMLRIGMYQSGNSGWFPGATIELAADGPRARLASGEPSLASEGFLRGALIVRLPAAWIDRELLLYLAADGSVREAGTDVAPLPVRRSGAFFLLDGEVRAVGPGPAWPPSAPRASDEPSSHIPPSPVRGPVVMHGGKALRSTGDVVPPGTRMALSFAARYRTRHGIRYQPILRLEWEGAEPWENPRWTAVNTSGRGVAPSERFPWLTRIRELAPEELQVIVRLEGDAPGLVLPPCEVAWMLEDGGTVLLHLPTLSTLHAATSDARWMTTHGAVGPAVGLAVDGSSRWPESGRIARYALGASAVAPIREHATLRRRRLRGCRLDLRFRAGRLDVDPSRGLFAFSGLERPQQYPQAGFLSAPPFPPPGPVTVDYQEGYSAHVGARSAPREPILGARQPVPTRVVGAKAGPRETTPPGVPHYLSLTDALQAIQADPAPAAHEVIQLDDSATHEELLPWPTNISRLTLQAAEGERPILQFQFQPPFAPELRYERLTLRGLVISGRHILLPKVEAVELQFCTWLSTGTPVLFAAPPGREVTVDVFRCVTGGLELRGPGRLTVRDSVVDAGTDGRALLAPEGMCELERVTVLGRTEVLVLEASEVIFDGMVTVTDRFHGCVRYSRVPQGAVLPRRHRVVEGVEVRFVSRDGADPAHARLAEDCDPAITRGAEDGSEMGAFHHVRLLQRLEALARRLTEYTPAGLTTGITRLD